jgi:hypothetical protein
MPNGYHGRIEIKKIDMVDVGFSMRRNFIGEYGFHTNWTESRDRNSGKRPFKVHICLARLQLVLKKLLNSKSH